MSNQIPAQRGILPATLSLTFAKPVPKILLALAIITLLGGSALLTEMGR